MELSDIMALVNAGFTKKDILDLGVGALTDPQDPTPAAPASGAADPVETATPETPAPVIDNSEVLAAIKDLTTTIRKNAIMRDSLQAKDEPSAVDILASVINPNKTK